MRKLLLGVGALLLASTAVPVAASEYNDYSGYGSGYNNNSGYGYNGEYGHGRGYRYGSDYAENVRRHVRACRQHARFHERLSDERDRYRDQGYYDGDDNADEHDAYHDRRGGIQNCGYWYRQYYNLKRSRTYDQYDGGYRW